MPQNGTFGSYTISGDSLPSFRHRLSDAMYTAYIHSSEPAVAEGLQSASTNRTLYSATRCGTPSNAAARASEAR